MNNILSSSKDGSTNEHVTSCRVQMQTIVFHRGGAMMWRRFYDDREIYVQTIVSR